MAASLKGLAGLVFGVQVVTGVVMQSFDEELQTKLAEATDEDGDVVGFSFYGGGRTDGNGDYLFKGAHIGSGTIAAILADITALGGGDTYLIKFARNRKNDAFQMGKFTTVAQSGITG